MTRQDWDKINSDREIISLRMDAEDLINNREYIDEIVYISESTRIKNAIEQRIQYLVENLENQSE